MCKSDSWKKLEIMIKIFVQLTDKKHEEHLIKGLSEIKRGLLISNKPDNAYDLILTDNTELILPGEKGIVLLDSYSIPPKSSENLIYTSINANIDELIILILNLLNNMSFLINSKVVYFSSPIGGSGVSTISYLFSRILFSKFEKRVLLIVRNEEAYFVKDKGIRPYNELRYLIETGMNFLIDDYVSRDDNGLDILICSEINDKLVSAISGNSSYEYLIIDGENYCERTENVVSYTVLNSKDIRYSKEIEKSKGVTISNFMEKNEIIHEVNNETRREMISLAKDEFAFKNRGTHYDIRNGTSIYTGVMEIVIDFLNRGKEDDQ